MEASSVTGPAKNLIGFCNWTQSPEAKALGLDLQISIATFCRTSQDGTGNAFIDAVRQRNIPIFVIPEQGRFDRGVVAGLNAVVSEVRPDIVQTHNVKSNFIFRVSGLHRSITWFAFQHGYTTTDLKMKAYNQLDRWTLRGADRVITVCRAFMPALEATGVDAEKIRILHNSVIPPASVMSEDDRQRLRAKWGIEAGEQVMVTIGRLSKEKGHEDLLQAVNRLHADSATGEWKLIVVGSGPERKQLEEFATRQGLTGRVIFAGFNAQVQEFYSMADIFVLPSHSEGSSNVLLEAMAAKVPIVATSAGGTPEIVSDDHTALLVPPRNAARLAEALKRILGDPALQRRLAEAAFERVQTSFSPEEYRRTLISIYREAAGR